MKRLAAGLGLVAVAFYAGMVGAEVAWMVRQEAAHRAAVAARVAAL